MSDRALVYGSYGYTGRLVTEQAVAAGLDPVLAGRTAREVEAQAVEHGLEHRTFTLETPQVVRAELADVGCVLNCAGPFARTADPLVDACLATGTDYLDVTGELDVFEALAGRDAEATEAGVTVLPGAGFDVVPTDSLAAHLADRHPDATHLALGFQGMTGVSPGTAHTAVDALGEGGAVRRDGRIESVPLAHDVRTVDFGRGATTAASIPWGDVSTAYHTTGVPNVTVYTAQSERSVRALRLARHADWLLGSDPVQGALHGLVDRCVEGPDERERETGRMYVWGEARNADADGDDRIVARLTTPGAYAFTARSAVSLLQRVQGGEASPGFHTPAGAFGSDAALAVDGVERIEDD